VDKYGRFKIKNMTNSPNPNPEERIQELKQRIASLRDRDHFTEDRDEDEYNCSNSSLCSTVWEVRLELTKQNFENSLHVMSYYESVFDIRRMLMGKKH
jgi:hypothetical protein